MVELVIRLAELIFHGRGSYYAGGQSGIKVKTGENGNGSICDGGIVLEVDPNEAPPLAWI
jgi:hypothetical protein